MPLIIAILAVGVLIIVHEAGHYFVARWCKMRVDRFSLGFGPAILKWKRGETDFTLGPIPFGGFVQIHGMLPSDEVDAKGERSYPNRPTWQRFATIFAGPATNYLFAIVLALVLFASYGVPRYDLIGGVEPEGAAHGVLQAGDRIVSINGEELYRVYRGVPAQLVTSLVNETNGGPVQLTILRDGKPMDVTIAPKLSDDDKGKRSLLGIKMAQAPESSRHPGKVVMAALAYPVVQTKVILSHLYDIITRKQEGKFSGPVEITKMIKDSYERGFVDFLALVMLLNVYLGLFNLLPLPALDGGRLAFLSYELATRRRPNPKIEATVHMVGIMALFVLLILVTYRDIADLF